MALQTNDILSEPINQQVLQEAVTFIDSSWLTLTRYNPHDNDTLIGLPYPYIIPSQGKAEGFAFQEMYYWDSYFIALGLFNTKHSNIAVGMLENLCALQKRFGLIPNASRFYHTSRSQPPFLTTYALEVFALTKDKEKLIEHINVAKEEYSKVWIAKKHPHWRNVFEGLSRNYQIDATHDLTETESGWDMNPRFDRKALHYLPVDLNSLLYKYEMDFAQVASIVGDHEEALEWLYRAKERQATMTLYMWDEKQGFFFDYNFKNNTQSTIYSLAAYYTMWAGLATPEQAQKMVEQLAIFEHAGGLSTTDRDYDHFYRFPMQWSYPNGWAPLQYLVISGLKRYGYHDIAKRIAEKWLQTCLIHFQKHGEFLEKYNVVDPQLPPKEGLYPSQVGFGWTNAIFIRLCQEYQLI